MLTQNYVAIYRLWWNQIKEHNKNRINGARFELLPFVFQIQKHPQQQRPQQVTDSHKIKWRHDMETLRNDENYGCVFSQICSTRALVPKAPINNIPALVQIIAIAWINVDPVSWYIHVCAALKISLRAPMDKQDGICSCNCLVPKRVVGFGFGTKLSHYWNW